MKMAILFLFMFLFVSTAWANETKLTSFWDIPFGITQEKAKQMVLNKEGASIVDNYSPQASDGPDYQKIFVKSNTMLGQKVELIEMKFKNNRFVGTLVTFSGSGRNNFNAIKSELIQKYGELGPQIGTIKNLMWRFDNGSIRLFTKKAADTNTGALKEHILLMFETE